MMGKTLIKRAEALEAEIKHEMSQLYLKLKETVLSEEQKARVRSRLHDLEHLITGQQAECQPCSGTAFFRKKK